MAELEDLERQIEELRVMVEDVADKFPIRSTTTAGAVTERHIHDLTKHTNAADTVAARATSSLTLTTTAQSIVGDGDSTKVRVLLPTAGECVVFGTFDFHVTVLDADNSAVGELFLNDSGSAETGVAVKEMEAKDRATVTQVWVVTTTVVNTPVELKARIDGGVGTALAVATHTNILAMAGLGGGTGNLSIGDHGGLTGRNDDDHVLYILQAGTRAFTGDQSMALNKITSLAEPTTDADAATKLYVDNNVGGGGDVPSPHDQTHHTGDVLPDADQTMIGKLTVQQTAGIILQLQNSTNTLLEYRAVGSAGFFFLRRGGVMILTNQAAAATGLWSSATGAMRLGDGVSPSEIFEVAGNALVTGTVKPQLGILMDEQSTPSNPPRNTVALFARANGDNIEIVALSSEGTECVITHNCTLDDTPAVAAPANILTLQWIE